MSKRVSYGKRMEHNLNAWNTRFAALEANPGEVVGRTEQLAAWKIAGDAASAKLVELRAAVARYGALREELETAWQAIAAVLGDLGPDERAVEPKAAARAARKSVS